MRVPGVDGAIAAWHKVPGTAPPQKSRPVGYGMIHAGVGTDSKIARSGSESRPSPTPRSRCENFRSYERLLTDRTNGVLSQGKLTAQCY